MTWRDPLDPTLGTPLNVFARNYLWHVFGSVHGPKKRIKRLQKISSWPVFTQISGRNFLPELCGEVHLENVPLQALPCPSFALQNRALLEGDKKVKRCSGLGRKRGGERWRQKEKKVKTGQTQNYFLQWQYFLSSLGCEPLAKNWYPDPIDLARTFGPVLHWFVVPRWCSHLSPMCSLCSLTLEDKCFLWLWLRTPSTTSWQLQALLDTLIPCLLESCQNNSAYNGLTGASPPSSCKVLSCSGSGIWTLSRSLTYCWFGCCWIDSFFLQVDGTEVTGLIRTSDISCPLLVPLTEYALELALPSRSSLDGIVGRAQEEFQRNVCV